MSMTCSLVCWASLPSLVPIPRKVSSHVVVCWISLPSLYQARKVSSHVFVCWIPLTSLFHSYDCLAFLAWYSVGQRYQACAKLGYSELSCTCLWGIVTRLGTDTLTQIQQSCLLVCCSSLPGLVPIP